MEDLTIDISQPCVIDFKMGTKTYWYGASEEKIKCELAKGPHQHEIGFRISGMRCYQSETNSFDMITDRKVVMALPPSEIPNALRKFLTNGSTVRTDVIPSIIDEISKLKKVFEDENNRLKFFCSSLLIIYEGDMTKPIKTKVKMIDFAHVTELRDENRDYGFIVGLNNLLTMFSSLKS